jgi:hypothetical protein
MLTLVPCTVRHQTAMMLFLVAPHKIPRQVLPLQRHSMEQHAFKNVKNVLNTNNYSYLETSGGQSFNPYLNVVHFFNARVD